MDNYEIVKGAKVKISRNSTEVTICHDMVFNTDFGKNQNHDPNAVGKYAEFNYAKRVKKRERKVREICKNSFETGKAMFVTLTFDPKKFNKDSLNTLSFTHGEFKKFIKRVNGHFEGFKYIATFARQGNGNWHYHMICNLCNKDKSTFAGLWDNGYITCNLIDSKEYYNNCVNYLIKNMSSSANDLKRKRGYLFSKNVERDIIVTSWRAEDVSEYDIIEQDILQSDKVYKKYEKIHHVGIKLLTVDTDTGEVEEDIVINQDLYANDVNYWAVDLNTTYTCYGLDKKYKDRFKPIETAAVKTTEHKKKKSKSNKK